MILLLIVTFFLFCDDLKATGLKVSNYSLRLPGYNDHSIANGCDDDADADGNLMMLVQI